MKRLVPALSSIANIACGLSLVAACGLGDAGGPTPPGGSPDAGNPEDVVPPGPENEQDDIVCQAALQVATGTFTESVAPPEGIDPEGCWPVGTWVFTVEWSNTTQCDEKGEELPTLLAEYRYEVTADEELNYTYTFLTDPDDLDVEMKVTSGGSGQCEGTFAHYLADGYGVLTLKPNQHADGTIDGQGDYELYLKPQI